MLWRAVLGRHRMNSGWILHWVTVTGVQRVMTWLYSWLVWSLVWNFRIKIATYFWHQLFNEFNDLLIVSDPWPQRSLDSTWDSCRYLADPTGCPSWRVDALGSHSRSTLDCRSWRQIMTEYDRSIRIWVQIYSDLSLSWETETWSFLIMTLHGSRVWRIDKKWQ